MNATRIIAVPANKPALKKYSVIIPSATYSKKMRSYYPYPLIKIDKEKKLIEYQIQNIKKSLKNVQIIVVGGFEYGSLKKLMPKNVDLVYNTEWDKTSVVSSISKGIEVAKYEDILVIPGNLAFNNRTLDVPIGVHSCAIIDPKLSKDKNKIGCTIDSNRVEHFMFGLSNRWSEIVYMTGKELDIAKKIYSNTEYHTYFHFEILNMIIDAGGRFSSIINKNIETLSVYTNKDMQKAKEIL